MNHPPVSVLILTFNEEANLARCLSSLSWCDDITVLDSFSTDKTQEIVAEYNAHFFQRRFDDYATQRNFGLNQLQHKYPWLLMVDADETVPPSLISEIRSTLMGCDDDSTLYRMRRKDYLFGKWIKHSSGYPTWFGRLIKIGEVQVERAINEEYITKGKIGMLENHLHHFPFAKGFGEWFTKHNRYSSMEANLIFSQNRLDISWPELFSSDPTKKRRAIKNIFYRLPFRPLFMFVALYVSRGGFLDGQAGLTFCLLRSFYEFMINCKIKELKYMKSSKDV